MSVYIGDCPRCGEAVHLGDDRFETPDGWQHEWCYDDERPATEFTLQSRGRTFRVTYLDDDVPIDPTVLIFRDDEEVAVATIHLNASAECEVPDHLVIPAHEVEP